MKFPLRAGSCGDIQLEVGDNNTLQHDDLRL